MKEKTKKVKKRLRFKVIIVFILIIYLLVSGVYYIINKPIKTIEVLGNNYLKDSYIINYLDINKESIFKVNKKKIKQKLLAIDLIEDVSIKKNYLGILKIDIKEADILFYNALDKKIVLSNGKEIDNDLNLELLGMPTLTNYVKEDILNDFTYKLTRVNKSILSMVSEIEYDPSKVGDKIIDDKRFKLLMNDGNIVYINTVNIEKFNDYLDIYEGIVSVNGDVKGCLYLDSSSENNHFNNCLSSGSGDNG